MFAIGNGWKDSFIKQAVCHLDGHPSPTKTHSQQLTHNGETYTHLVGGGRPRVQRRRAEPDPRRGPALPDGRRRQALLWHSHGDEQLPRRRLPGHLQQQERIRHVHARELTKVGSDTAARRRILLHPSRRSRPEGLFQRPAPALPHTDLALPTPLLRFATPFPPSVPPPTNLPPTPQSEKAPGRPPPSRPSSPRTSPTS